MMWSGILASRDWLAMSTDIFMPEVLTLSVTFSVFGSWLFDFTVSEECGGEWYTAGVGSEMEAPVLT